MSQKCTELREAIKKANIALIEQTKVDYPIGCRIKVRIGRATVVGKVVSYIGGWWSGSNGAFNIINEKTGANRTVRPDIDYSNIEILKDGE